MCFGGNDSSEKVVEMQEDEAEEARLKEEERQARIDQGLTSIQTAFGGSPLYASDSSKGYYDTGKTVGGFDDEFYNAFRDAMTGYYMPQVQEQYGDAKDELTYRLARAGTLRSSAAAEEQADLAGQNVEREAEVYANADTAVGGLKDRVASERAKAEAQLYATEDPSVAANQALAAVENISAETPDLTPLGAIFDIATIGGAGAASGYQNAEYLKKYGLSRSSDASRVV